MMLRHCTAHYGRSDYRRLSLEKVGKMLRKILPFAPLILVVLLLLIQHQDFILNLFKVD